MPKKQNGQSITWQHDRRRLGDLVPWEHNPRQIKKEQAARLLESLETFGQIHAIAVGPENQIYDGHQRDAVWAASNKYGPSYEIDVRVASRALTDKERAKLVVYLHKGTAGEFDFDALANLPEVDLADLTSWGFDESELVGFGSEEGDADADVDLDQAAELNKKWQVKTGDLWRISEHRLMCGDSTRAEDLKRLLGDKRATASVTDPPYNVGIDYQNNQSDQQTQTDYDDFSRTWFKLARQCTDILVFTPGRGKNLINLHMWFAIEKPFDMAIWVKKNSTTHGSLAHFMAWEALLVYGKPEGRTGQDVYDFPIINQFSGDTAMTDLHPTPKRLELWQTLIKDFSADGDVIYEPFAGSGTTVVACQNIARKCFGLEINPGYCAVILERMTIAFPGIKIEKQ